ncbi:hypothetical protein ACE8GQ_20785 [Xanthomonas euvesicatoria pv. euvesicatoria]|uniref:hypothetical protein n=1 Tax=Xanthomonas euvesicatoria TaxID=456327 RepID=UPI001112BDCB|nr:hypothetical protein [Xanthomonas euvesicatoria]MBV6690363.1 hypothetical protein [Xanthomonas euvesicatoria pv. physalidis]MBV6795938.1 hypothetical protein [Xanthomonas campestris pv. daturae]
MSIEQTKKLRSTRSEENANRLLIAGWTLLLVADRVEVEHQWLVYQMAWQHDNEPVDITSTGVEPGTDPF